MKKKKPKIIKEHYPNGKLRFKLYHIKGKQHREDGPALIEYYYNGQINYEYYSIKGKCHREDGPALISYFDNGQIAYEKYYLNGKKITESEWLIHKRKRKLKTLN